MSSWFKAVLKVVPINLILEYILGALEEEVKKTENQFDDLALNVIKSILKETGLMK
jgi:hypothetical protein